MTSSSTGPLNILFIMYDQLRFDYLSCAGHPHLQTPNMDRVANDGVRFTNAYVQSPICGASRMSFYTGRYAASHGAQWNGFPLRVGEMTLGDHLRSTGMDCWLIGKTHMRVDAAGMERLGLNADSVIGARQAQCGFDVWVRDDGLWGYGPDGFYDPNPQPYNSYLQRQGYDGDNPWADYANAGVDGNDIASGWFMENADKPANIREEDSETAWLTDRALEFLRMGKGPWCAHVSYIKPHWPYIVPAPYHALYGPEHQLPLRSHPMEDDDPHPIYAAFRDRPVSGALRRDDVRAKVISAYMGLIKQCDDHLGRLLDHLAATDQLEHTMIVITSDHGDYLGDHGLGEKDLFHEPSVKVPLMIYDPRPVADSTRGTTCDALVEAIDLAPTFLAAAGGAPAGHILEGRDLTPWLHGTPPADWRDYVISEYDYSITPMRNALGVSEDDARLFMICDGRWKMIHAEGGFAPMLYDLETDPEEYHDLGRNPDYGAEITRLYGLLAQWGRRNAQRVTRSAEDLAAMRGKSLRRGILPFLVDGSEVDPALTQAYRGPARQRHTKD